MSARGLDQALPAWHHRERHSIHVDAAPERALAAARAVGAGDVLVVRALFRLRGLPAPRDRSLLESMRAVGFDRFADDVLVAIGRPWAPRTGLRVVHDFAAFAEPGWAKLGLDFRAVPEGGGCRLETETRVYLTDRRARRRFAAYWLVVRPFSGLVRRSWLRAAKRRAEHEPP